MAMTEQQIEELVAQAHENVMVVVREAQHDREHGQVRIDVAARREIRRVFDAGRADAAGEQIPKS